MDDHDHDRDRGDCEEDDPLAFHSISIFEGATTIQACNDHLEERACVAPEAIPNCRQCKYPLTRDGYMIGAAPLVLDATDTVVAAKVQRLLASFDREVVLLAARQLLEEENPLPRRTFGIPVVQHTSGKICTSHSFCSVGCIRRYSIHNPTYNAPEVDGLISDMAVRAGVPLERTCAVPDEGMLCHQGGPLSFRQYAGVAHEYDVSMLDSIVFERRKSSYQFVKKGAAKDSVPRYRLFLQQQPLLPPERQSHKLSSNKNQRKHQDAQAPGDGAVAATLPVLHTAATCEPCDTKGHDASDETGDESDTDLGGTAGSGAAYQEKVNPLEEDFGSAAAAAAAASPNTRAQRRRKREEEHDARAEHIDPVEYPADPMQHTEHTEHTDRVGCSKNNTCADHSDDGGSDEPLGPEEQTTQSTRGRQKRRSTHGNTRLQKHDAPTVLRKHAARNTANNTAHGPARGTTGRGLRSFFAPAP